VRGLSLSPSSEAIVDLESAAENARASGGERFVVSIPGCLAWTDGRWLILGPSRDHAESARPELLERVTPWLVAWRRLWGIPVLFRDPELRKSDKREPVPSPEKDVKSDVPFDAARESVRGLSLDEAAELSVLTNRLEVQTSGIENLPDRWREAWRDWMEAGRVAVFDADQLKGSPRLRPYSTDDRLAMEGGGRKDAMQALAEAGIPEALRARVPILTDDEGILWLVGIRRASRAFVTPDTRRMLLVRTPEKAHVRPPMQ
jgi:tRNA(Ile)-lysidine synthetase-like protein